MGNEFHGLCLRRTEAYGASVSPGGQFPLARFIGLGPRAQEPGSGKAREAPAPLDPTQAAEEIWQYVLERPDVIRLRASYAATAAAVVATGVAVVGGGLASTGRFPVWVTAPLAVTVVLWILGVGAWVWAIGGPLQPIDPRSPLDEVIDHATENAEAARARLSFATWLTGLALLATMVGFALAAYHSESQDDPVAAMIELTPRAAYAAQELCHWKTDARQVYGEVRLVELSRPVVTIAMPGQESGQPEDDKKVVFGTIAMPGQPDDDEKIAFDGPELRLRSSAIVVASEHAIKKHELTQPQCEVQP
jgi:hypothetical protein